MSLESIANITIDLRTQGVTTKSFGVPCVLGYTTALASLATEYNLTTALADLVADGVWIDTPIYRAVASIAANTNRPEKVVVGKLQVAYQQDGTITVLDPSYLGVSGDVDPAAVYALSVWAPPQSAILPSVETTVSITAGALATTTTVATALAAAIDAVTDITATSATSVVTWDADNTGESFYFTGIDERQLEFEDTTIDTGLVAAFTAIRAVNDTFYGVYLADGESQARLDVMGNHVETLEKMMCFTTRDGEVGDSGVSDDIFSTLQGDSLIRSVGMYSGDQGKMASATWMGQMFTKDPGSATWCYKTLPTIAADDLTSNFVAQILAKGGNWYEEIAGINVVQTGQMASGEWADVVRGRDWLLARLRERFANLAFNVGKIPYTDSGIASVVNMTIAQLSEGITQGYIAADPEPIVTAPAAEDVDAADKTARVLRNVYFQAVLQGAIHTLVMNGVLTY